MIIITKFLNNITKYVKLGKKISYIFPDPYGCKHCGFAGRLHRHGFYERNVITLNATYRIFVLRILCPKCRRTFSYLPEFLIPFYQYSFELIFFCLYNLYVLKESYAKIIKAIGDKNPKCHLNSMNLHRFKSRMKMVSPAVRLFFAKYDEFYTDMDKDDIAIIVEKIKLFNETYNDKFNLNYYSDLGRYFFRVT